MLFIFCNFFLPQNIVSVPIGNTDVKNVDQLAHECGSDGKESACNVGDPGLIPGLRRSPGKGKGCPLQYCGLENSESDTTE